MPGAAHVDTQLPVRLSTTLRHLTPNPAAAAAAGNPPDDDTFAGASCAAQSGAGDGNRCDRCDRTFLNQSAVAYLDKGKNWDFSKLPNFEVHKAIQKARADNGAAYQNMPGVGSSVTQVCAICAEELHDVPKGTYVTYRPRVLADPGPGPDDVMVPFPTNTWENKARQTKGISRGNKSKLSALKTWDEKFERQRKLEEGPVKVTSVQVAEAMKSEEFCQALDWITELATFCFLFYGCVCGLYPLASNWWWRLKRLCVQATAGKTVAGAAKDYRWHCGECGKHWTWTEGGHQRLLCVGNFEDEGCNAFFAYIGNTKDTTLENTINYLKGCRMLTQLDGRPVTRENIVATIQEMNNNTAKKLSRVLKRETRTVVSKVPDVPNWAPYCEVPELSLHRGGIPYICIDLNLVQLEKEVPTLDLEQLEELLHQCASGLDIEGMPPKNDNQTAARNRVLKSAAFGEARANLRSRI